MLGDGVAQDLDGQGMPAGRLGEGRRAQPEHLGGAVVRRTVGHVTK